MRFTIFQSDKGDCVLLTGRDGKQVLVDGGMRDSYTKHVSPVLNRLHRNKKKIDVVCVSHIDRDHVWGVLQMMDDLVDWRVHEFQIKNGNPTHRAPKSKRPPEVKEIWHNAFHEQLGKNAGPIEEMLAAQARILSGHDNPRVLELAEGLGELALSEGDAIRLSRRVGAKQLNIPLNPDYDGRLMFHAGDDPLRVGGMRMWVIGPYASELSELRKRWNEWLQANKNELGRIRRRARGDEERLATSELDLVVNPLRAQARELASSSDFAIVLNLVQKVLGRRESVTIPNLASLMLLVEEKGKKILLTGDGHWEDILDGLDDAGRLDANGRLHVSVLKVPHHGSEHNTHPDFCKAITADHYVFCGNGAHANPDLDVVNAYIDSRLGKPSQLSPNPEVTRPYKLWFSCSSKNPNKTKHITHMRKLEKLVRARAKKSSGRMRFKLMTRSSEEFNV